MPKLTKESKTQFRETEVEEASVIILAIDEAAADATLRSSAMQVTLGRGSAVAPLVRQHHWQEPSSSLLSGERESPRLHQRVRFYPHRGFQLKVYLWVMLGLFIFYS